MIPNNPKADPKISIINILTNVSGVWASDIAHPEPVTPTQTLCYLLLPTNQVRQSYR